MGSVVLNNFTLKQGHCLELKGLLAKDAKGFCVNLGKDASNLILHFNPRFDQHGDTNVIVCNSKEADVWGTEQRSALFPFVQGTENTVCFEHLGDNLKIKLSNGEEFTFPIRMAADSISFLSLDGIEIKSIAFH